MKETSKPGNRVCWGLLAIVISQSALVSYALAEDDASRKTAVEASGRPGHAAGMITPIFGQLLAMSFPKGFNQSFAHNTGVNYIQESVLDGETSKKWTQMITVTGANGLAANPELTPQKLADRISGGFKRACPESFSGKNLGEMRIGVHDGFGAVMSCGTVTQAGQSYSESMLLVVIKGQSDYYTVQWAERGRASKSPMKLDEAKWNDRLKRLSPIRLCPIVPGEPAPYPSCVNRK